MEDVTIHEYVTSRSSIHSESQSIEYVKETRYFFDADPEKVGSIVIEIDDKPDVADSWTDHNPAIWVRTITDVRLNDTGTNSAQIAYKLKKYAENYYSNGRPASQGGYTSAPGAPSWRNARIKLKAVAGSEYCDSDYFYVRFAQNVGDKPVATHGTGIFANPWNTPLQDSNRTYNAIYDTQRRAYIPETRWDQMENMTTYIYAP